MTGKEITAVEVGMWFDAALGKRSPDRPDSDACEHIASEIFKLETRSDRDPFFFSAEPASDIGRTKRSDAFGVLDRAINDYELYLPMHLAASAARREAEGPDSKAFASFDAGEADALRALKQALARAKPYLVSTKQDRKRAWAYPALMIAQHVHGALLQAGSNDLGIHRNSATANVTARAIAHLGFNDGRATAKGTKQTIGADDVATLLYEAERARKTEHERLQKEGLKAFDEILTHLFPTRQK